MMGSIVGVATRTFYRGRKKESHKSMHLPYLIRELE